MFCFVYVYKCFPYTNVWVLSMCLQRSEEGVGYPGTAVTDDYKIIRRWQKLKPEPLKVWQDNQDMSTSPFLNIYAYIHRSVLLSTLEREFRVSFFSSRQWLIYRQISVQIAEKTCLWVFNYRKHPYQLPLIKFRKYLRRVGTKTVWARRWGEDL